MGVRLKWPNDAFLGGRKFSGCLSEFERVPASPKAKVFIGVGVNLNEGFGFTCLREHT